MNNKIDNILNINLRPVLEAKQVLEKFINVLESDTKGNLIEKRSEPNIKFSYFDYKKSFSLESACFLQNSLNLMYDYIDLQNFTKNNFDPSWVNQIKQDITNSLLKENKLLDLIKFNNLSLKKDFDHKSVVEELTQLFFQSLRQCYAKNQRKDLEQDFGIETSSFYNELGRVLTDYYYVNLKIKKDSNLEIYSIYEKLYKEIKNNSGFSKGSEKEFITLYKKIIGVKRYKNIHFYNSIDTNFSKFMVDTEINSEIEQKFDIDVLVFIKNRLNIQYVEYSGVILNSILDNFFCKSTKYLKKKTYNFFYPKQNKINLVYYSNSGLPSIDFDFYKLKEDLIDIKFSSHKYFVGSRVLHKKFSLQTKYNEKAFQLLGKLKKNNKFRINIECLNILCGAFFQKTFFFAKEFFDIDFDHIFIELQDFDLCEKLFLWAFDLNDISSKFKVEGPASFFLHKVVDKIFSYKINIFYTIKQAVIMSCFECFYFDWFFDSRGRFYIENTFLSIQGSSLSRSLVEFFSLKTEKLSEGNLNLMHKTLKTMVNDASICDQKKEYSLEDCFVLNIKQGELLNFFFLQRDFFKKKYSCHSYALDASNSGLQILSIILRNKNLGQKCGLVLNNKNSFESIYSMMIEFTLKSFSDLKEKDFYLDIPKIEAFLNNKKIPKIILMTLPYGSTLFGRLDQMQSSYQNFCIKNGVVFSKENIKKLRKLLCIIDKKILNWCEKELPECLKLRRLVKDFVKSDDFDNSWISNGFIRFKYKLFYKDTTRRKVGMFIGNSKQKSKISVVHFVPLSKLSKSKKSLLKTQISNSFMANLVHSIDAHLALNIVNKIIAKNIFFYTIHDCFRIDYNNAFLLKKIVKQCYIELFEYNFINANGLNEAFDVSNFNDMDLAFFKNNINYDFFVKE